MDNEIDDRPPPPRLRDCDPTHLVKVGGPLENYTISLRVLGDDLDPDEVTQLLHADPTDSRRKGDRLPGRYARSAKEGAWFLELAPDETADRSLDQSVDLLLSRLTPDLSSWEKLTGRYEVDIFVGIFLEHSNEGFELNPSLMARLAERRITIGFDIYDTADDD